MFQTAVGPPGIEPGLYEPESHVLPVYYGPIAVLNASHQEAEALLVRLSGFEPETFRM